MEPGLGYLSFLLFFWIADGIWLSYSIENQDMQSSTGNTDKMGTENTFSLPPVYT